MSRNINQQQTSLTQLTTNGNEKMKMNKTQIENGKIKKFDLLIRHVRPPINPKIKSEVSQTEKTSPFQNYSSIGNILKYKKQSSNKNTSKSKSNSNINYIGNNTIVNISNSNSNNKFKKINSVYNLSSLVNNTSNNINNINNIPNMRSMHNIQSKNLYQNANKENHIRTKSIPVLINIKNKNTNSKSINKETEIKNEFLSKISKIQIKYKKQILNKTDIETYLNEVSSAITSSKELKNINDGLFIKALNKHFNIIKAYINNNTFSHLHDNILKMQIQQKNDIIQRLEHALNEFNYVISVKNKEIKQLKDKYLIVTNDNINSKLNNNKDIIGNMQYDNKESQNNNDDNRIIIKNTQNDIFTLNTLHSMDSVESMFSKVGSEYCESTGNLDVLISNKKEFLKPVNIPDLLLDDVNVIYNGEFALNDNKSKEIVRKANCKFKNKLGVKK